MKNDRKSERENSEGMQETRQRLILNESDLRRKTLEQKKREKGRGNEMVVWYK